MVQSVTTKAVKSRVERLLDGRYHGDQPLRTLFLILQGQRNKLILATIIYIIKQSPQWFLPFAIYHIVDAAHDRGPKGLHTIIEWSAVCTLCLAQNIPMHTYYSNLMSSVIRESQRDLRSALVVRLQQLSVSFHNENESGRMQAKVMRDVDNIGGVLKGGGETIVSTLILGGVSMGVAISKSPLVAVFFIVAAPAASLLARTFQGALRRNNADFRKQMEGISVRMNEMIEMLPITRAHAAEGSETAKMRRQLGRLTASGRRMDIVTERFSASVWVTFNTFQVLCLIFCAMLVRGGQLTIGELVMFQSYFGMIVGSVSGMLGIMPQMTAGAESIRSLSEVLESDEVEIDDGKYEIERVDGDLVFDHLGFTYPKAGKPAIHDLSLHVHKGECIALVGESGSGKSTIVNLVIGFHRPTSGRLILDGRDMSEINYRSFRRHIAIVPQNTVLFSGTIRDNITYGLDNVSESKLMDALDRANCTEFVSRQPDGLDTRIGPHGGKLSGGQRQRIAIARALLRDPEMLILDEATSALDAHSEYLVQQAIEQLIQGRTTIIIAHRLSTLKVAKRIVVLRDGEIIEEGSWADLLAKPGSTFASAYALQTDWAEQVTAAKGVLSGTL